MAVTSEEKLEKVEQKAAAKSVRKVFRGHLTDDEMALISEIATRDSKSLLKQTIGYCMVMSSKKSLKHKERTDYLSLAVQGMKTIVAADAKRLENSMRQWFGLEHQAGPETEGPNPVFAPSPHSQPN